MTEAEWLACDSPVSMCRYLEKRHLTQRKPRLVAVAWCRRFPNRLPDSSLQTVLDVVECFADGMASQEDLHNAEQVAVEVTNQQWGDTTFTSSAFSHTAQAVEVATHDDPDAPYIHRLPDVSRHIASAAGYAVATMPWDGMEQGREAEYRQAEATEEQALTELLRDIFGNPFRTVTFSPSWRTDTALTLARQMYESRDFSAMPILADALQDAGCDNDEILSHCRDANQVHVRGCWVVDLMLGKE